MDALADHPNQVDKSSYAYAWNNPVNLTDPDGNCPHCLPAVIAGGVIGAGLEIYNQWDDESFNYGEILNSTGKGAATAGLIAVGAGGSLASTALVGAAASGGVEATSQLITTGEIDVGTVALATAVGGVPAPVGGVIAGRLSSSVSASSAASASETFIASTTSTAVKSAQNTAVKNMASGATNAQISATRSAAKSAVRASANETLKLANQSAARTSAIIKGASGAAGTKTASGVQEGIISRIKNWWNGN